MLESPIYSLGVPPAFVKVPTEANYFLERDAYERCYNRYEMAVAGFVWSQAEATDWTEWSTALATYETDFITWLDNAVDAQTDGLPVPSPPSPPAPMPGVPWWITAIQLAIQVVKLIIWWWKKKKERGTDTSELVSFLREALMLPDPAHEGQFIPLIELLANAPLEIIVNRSGDFQDAVYSSHIVEE